MFNSFANSKNKSSNCSFGSESKKSPKIIAEMFSLNFLIFRSCLKYLSILYTGSFKSSAKNINLSSGIKSVPQSDATDAKFPPIIIPFAFPLLYDFKF